MKKKYFVSLILGYLVLSVDGMPPPAAMAVEQLAISCLGNVCDLNSGPVCAIDAEGEPRTFENRCMTDMSYCRYGIYYAVVKAGEC